MPLSSDPDAVDISSIQPMGSMSDAERAAGPAVGGFDVSNGSHTMAIDNAARGPHVETTQAGAAIHPPTKVADELYDILRHKVEGLADRATRVTTNMLNFAVALRALADASASVTVDLQDFYSACPQRLTPFIGNYHTLHTLVQQQASQLEHRLKEDIVTAVGAWGDSYAGIQARMAERQEARERYGHYLDKITTLRNAREKTIKKGRLPSAKEFQRLERNETKLDEARKSFLHVNEHLTAQLIGLWNGRFAYVDHLVYQFFDMERGFCGGLAEGFSALSSQLSELLQRDPPPKVGDDLESLKAQLLAQQAREWGTEETAGSAGGSGGDDVAFSAAVGAALDTLSVASNSTHTTFATQTTTSTTAPPPLRVQVSPQSHSRLSVFAAVRRNPTASLSDPIGLSPTASDCNIDPPLSTVSNRTASFFSTGSTSVSAASSAATSPSASSVASAAEPAHLDLNSAIAANSASARSQRIRDILKASPLMSVPTSGNKRRAFSRLQHQNQQQQQPVPYTPPSPLMDAAKQYNYSHTVPPKRVANSHSAPLESLFRLASCDSSPSERSSPLPRQQRWSEDSVLHTRGSSPTLEGDRSPPVNYRAVSAPASQPQHLLQQQQQQKQQHYHHYPPSAVDGSDIASSVIAEESTFKRLRPYANSLPATGLTYSSTAPTSLSSSSFSASCTSPLHSDTGSASASMSSPVLSDRPRLPPRRTPLVSVAVNSTSQHSTTAPAAASTSTPTSPTLSSTASTSTLPPSLPPCAQPTSGAQYPTPVCPAPAALPPVRSVSASTAPTSASASAAPIMRSPASRKPLSIPIAAAASPESGFVAGTPVNPFDVLASLALTQAGTSGLIPPAVTTPRFSPSSSSTSSSSPFSLTGAASATRSAQPSPTGAADSLVK